MKTERERIIEISAILIALFLFLILVTLFIGLVIKPSSNKENLTGQAVSINPSIQKTYSNQILNEPRCKTELIPYYGYEYDYKKDNSYLYYDDYYGYDNYKNYNLKGKQYSSYKTEKSYEGFFGNRVDEYNVYVKNRGYETDLFSVRFYFEDYKGREWTERVDHYIKSGESKKFSVKDIKEERFNHRSWHYKVYEDNFRFDYNQDEYRLERYPVQKYNYKIAC